MVVREAQSCSYRHRSHLKASNQVFSETGILLIHVTFYGKLLCLTKTVDITVHRDTIGLFFMAFCNILSI